MINAYWNLVEAREQLVVAEQSLALARELHERNRIQVEVGTLAPLELVQSEAAIATRDEDIIRATAAVGDAEDELRRLLNLPPGPALGAADRATTDPALTARPDRRRGGDRRRPGRTRPDLRNQQLAIERARVERQFFANQTRPQLNLEVAYGSGGSATRFTDAFEQFYGIDFPDWTVGLSFAYPIQNRAARAQTAIADLEVELTEVELEQLVAMVRTEVRRAVRGVETAAKQIEAARASRVFQDRNLDAERKRYENGMSTSFQITQIQDDLTLARSREVNAIVDYRTALAEFYRATGRCSSTRACSSIDQEPAVNRFSFHDGSATMSSLSPPGRYAPPADPLGPAAAPPDPARSLLGAPGRRAHRAGVDLPLDRGAADLGRRPAAPMVIAPVSTLVLVCRASTAEQCATRCATSSASGWRAQGQTAAEQTLAQMEKFGEAMAVAGRRWPCRSPSAGST